MRVNDSNHNAVTIGTRQSGRVDTVQTGRSNRYGENGESSEDRVSLSNLVHALSQPTADAPGRLEKIGQLAAAFRAGSYRVQPEAVAASMVNESIQVA